MAWKSRQDKAPPPQFFADVIGYLQKAFPRAVLTREAIAELAPYLVGEWQNGQSARNAAKATCACDGQRITVSPAAQVQVPRRAALPPQGATRGMTFGIDALRERREVGKLRAQAAVEDRHAEYQEALLRRLQAEPSAQAEKKRQAAQAALKTHRAAAARLRQEAEQFARERGFWIPPAAEAHATQEAAKKRIGPRRETAQPAPAKAPARSGRKKPCAQCTEAQPPPENLEALVDEFVEAALKEEGK